MRTTLDIDDDILTAAKELAQRDRRTAGEMISELARRGLTASIVQKKRPVMRSGVPILPSRGKLITLEHIQRIRDEENI
jgi:hypothetical protein